MIDHDHQVAPPALARRQFDAFNEVGRMARLRDEDRYRLLLMSPQEWSAWEAFLEGDGAPPPQPAVPVVLMRLAIASYQLAVRADRGVEPSARALH